MKKTNTIVSVNYYLDASKITEQIHDSFKRPVEIGLVVISFLSFVTHLMSNKNDTEVIEGLI